MKTIHATVISNNIVVMYLECGNVKPSCENLKLQLSFFLKRNFSSFTY